MRPIPNPAKTNEMTKSGNGGAQHWRAHETTWKAPPAVMTCQKHQLDTPRLGQGPPTMPKPSLSVSWQEVNVEGHKGGTHIPKRS